MNMRPSTIASRRTTQIASGALAAGALLVLGAGPAAASGSGYGPPQAGPVNVPGGFSNVVTAKTLTVTGGSVSAPVPGGSLQVEVPPGDFTSPVEVEITAPSLTSVERSLPTLGLSKFTAVGGMGISLLTRSGQKLTGHFAHPITVTLTGVGLGLAGQVVVEITGPSSFVRLPSTLGHGRITFSILADPDVVVLSSPTAGSVSSGATAVHTGEPFLGEGIVAGGLAGVGGLLLALGLRRRPTRKWA
ncbi:MAG: hypothetical protein M0Z33_13690 [Actinomycetota bacterium]|nr:hypothetical protein [Actinomycetota bacterium]